MIGPFRLGQEWRLLGGGTIRIIGVTRLLVPPYRKYDVYMRPGTDFLPRRI